MQLKNSQREWKPNLLILFVYIHFVCAPVCVSVCLWIRFSLSSPEQLNHWSSRDFTQVRDKLQFNWIRIRDRNRCSAGHFSWNGDVSGDVGHGWPAHNPCAIINFFESTLRQAATNICTPLETRWDRAHFLWVCGYALDAHCLRTIFPLIFIFWLRVNDTRNITTNILHSYSSRC